MKFLKRYKKELLLIALVLSMLFIESIWLLNNGFTNLSYIMLICCGYCIGLLVAIIILDIETIFKITEDKNGINYYHGYRHEEFETDLFLQILLYEMLVAYKNQNEELGEDFINLIFNLIDSEKESISEDYIVDKENKVIRLKNKIKE